MSEQPPKDAGVATGVTLTLVHSGTLSPALLAELGRYAATCNADPRGHCGFVGVEADEVTADFRDLEGEHVFAVARDGDRLCGLLCAEWDLDLDIGRTWLLGPWADTPELSDQLYDAVRSVVPADAVEHELFCDAENTAAAAFARRHGFTGTSEQFIMRFSREGLGELAPVTPAPLSHDLAEQFAALHDRAFPNTFAPSAVLLDGLDRLDRRPRILIEVEGGTLLGYVTLKLRPEFADAQIEHIAVTESARGRGIGARLLTAALHEAFTDPRYQVMDLVTGDPAARRLYERVGFTLHRNMRSFRTPPPGA